MKITINTKLLMLAVIINSLSGVLANTKETDKDFDDDYILSGNTMDEEEKCKTNAAWDNYDFGKEDVTKDVALTSLLAWIFEKSPPFQMKRGKTPKGPHSFQIARNMPCSCEMEHKVMDLGNLYFPRYIPTAVCRQGRCRGGPYRCHQRHYRVRVLKQREMDDQDPAAQLPESLKDFWIAESVSVTVGCECAP